MDRRLRVLLIEDNEDDAALMLRELQRGGYEPIAWRVETPVAMAHALQQETWDVVLADWSLPQFSALFALEMLKSKGLDLPFIIVSGTIGEEAATSAMKAGAHNFVSKQHLERLVLTIERELREVDDRRARRKTEAALAASEERLQLVARATNDAVRDWDLVTNGMWWSEGLSSLFGYESSDIEPGVESWSSRLHPADKDRVIVSCYAAINGGTTAWSENYRFRRTDGTYAEVLDRSYVVRNVRGKALRLIGAITDLARWNDPESGLISPATFIPLAEETGLILPIGEAILRQACRQLKLWHEAGYPSLKMSVNLSARQFRQPDLASCIAAVLAETGLDPDCLELELTESCIMQDAEVALQTLGKLKTMGVRLSIDDFGTGYSSLIYLRRFPIDTLKIDRAFTQDMMTSDDAQAIIAAIIAMAAALKLSVIAEGVETEEQMALLLKQKCYLAQGFAFCKPIPAAELTARLATWPGLERHISSHGAAA